MQKTPEKYYNDCLLGAVNVIIDFWGPGLKDQASQLCQLLEGPHKKTCYENIIGRIGGIFKDGAEKRAVCDTMNEPYKDNCLNLYRE